METNGVIYRVNKMKICLVGPGIMPIPPTGWGAVERAIWYRSCALSELGHEGDILNTPDMNEITAECLNGDYDVIHFHYDQHYPVVDYLYDKVKCPILFSSHYPYIEQVNMHRRDGYDKIFDYILNNGNKFYNFSVSPKNYDFFIENGFPKDRIFHLREGPLVSEFRYNSECENPNKSLYLGQIHQRKKQYLYQSIPGIDFVGKYFPGTSFDPENKNYLGELKSNDIITSYANLVHLSDGENGTAMVIMEALILGLGVVVSEQNVNELDTSLNFIEVIPNEKLNDLEYISKKIFENRKVSLEKRNEIREYGIESFSLVEKMKKYVNDIENIINL